MNDWKLHGDQCLLPIPKFSNLNAPPNKQREHLTNTRPLAFGLAAIPF